jgi:hypothetical protein
MIVRTFQNIRNADIEKADQRAFLLDLGWWRGRNWNDLLKAKRVMLISESGAGKTYECQQQAEQLFKIGEPAFFIELASLAERDLTSLLDLEQEARLNSWLKSQSDIATFFLDSIDELKLTRKSFEVALKSLLRVIQPHLARVRLVITTRPVSFDRTLLERLFPVPQMPAIMPSPHSFAESVVRGSKDKDAKKSHEKSGDWQTVALIPLSNDQIQEFAKLRGVPDALAFLATVNQRNALDFVRRPQDLIELIADWNREEGGTHATQVAANIRVKLLPREDRAEPADVSAQRAREGAMQLALAAMLTRRFTIRHNAESDHLHDGAAIDPVIILRDWQRDERQALLERPLFGFASYGRVRFHHRSVIEYLAAQQLVVLRDQGMALGALRRLLFAETQGRLVTRPSLRAVTSWFASMEPAIFEALRVHDPLALIELGDPQSLSKQQRAQILRRIVEDYGRGGWRGLSIEHVQILRFASPDLAPEISRLWHDGVDSAETRELLLNLIEGGRITDCADIAYHVANDGQAPHGERISAISAVVALRDTRLTFMAQEVADGADNWPSDMARSALTFLFPTDLSVSQFFGILSRLPATPRTVAGLEWQLPRLIQNGEFDLPTLESLRDGFVSILSQNLHWDASSHRVVSNHAYLHESLAAVCLKGPDANHNADWLYAAVLALRLQESGDTDNTIMSALETKLLAGNAMDTARLFWVEDGLIQMLQPTDNPCNRLAEILFRNNVVILNAERDLTWICEQLAEQHRSLAERAVLLEAAMHLLRGRDDWQEAILTLSDWVADQGDLRARISEYLSGAEIYNRDGQQWQEERAVNIAKREQRDAAAMASWHEFWTKVVENPDQAFSKEEGLHTAWNLWRAMDGQGQRSQSSGWHRRFIESHFSKAMADRLRQTLMTVWRKESPTLPGERSPDERGTTLVRWQLCLAAIYAEAEDPNWATHLNEQEAQRAARYALIELNGLPSWLEQLVACHADAVDAVLGESLSWELAQPPVNSGHSMQLQSVHHAPPIVARLFLPRLVLWLETGGDRVQPGNDLVGHVHRITMTVETLIEKGGEAQRAALLQIARVRWQSDIPPELRYVWLPTLIRLAPEEGVSALTCELETICPAERSEAITWFSVLFNGRRNSINLSQDGFTPQLLLKLLRLSYIHVRVDDDAVHEGSYTPGVRDDAEQARNIILKALFDIPGEAGWSARLDMANDPLYAHFRDRIMKIAEERRAEDLDATVYDEKEVNALFESMEAPLTSPLAMLALMRNRLEDLDNLLVSDDSPWETWAGITTERLMRRVIARELKLRANGLYQVYQESVTAEEKETDIRLQASASEQEAVIELKLGDGRSGRDLRDTIEKQLVKKYLAPAHRRAGFLLITVAKVKKHWEHPETKMKLDLDGLLGMLREEVRRLESALGGAVHVDVHVLDLRPRLPKESEAGVVVK